MERITGLILRQDVSAQSEVDWIFTAELIQLFVLRPDESRNIL